MKLLCAAVCITAALSSPTWAQTAPQDHSTAASTQAGAAPEEATDEENEEDSRVVCRTRPRAASRLGGRSNRICMTVRDWRIADAEAQDELRRMMAPGAVNRVNPNGS